MSRIQRVVTMAALATVAAAAAAQQQTEAASFLGRLAGEWQGTGEVRQMAADMRMHWESVLDGQFFRLSMENRMTAWDGQAWHFKAQGYYRAGEDGAISGTWFDSRGVSLPLAGRVEGDVLTIDWGDADSVERGRSTYTLAADALEVTDAVYGKDGALAVFGRTRLTKQEGTFPSAPPGAEP